MPDHTPTTMTAPVSAPSHPLLRSGDALTADQLDRHVLAGRNARLHGLAQGVLLAKRRLLELTAVAQAVSQAVESEHDGGPSAECWLRDETARIEAEIRSAELGAALEKARLSAWSARSNPLVRAVDARHSELVAGRARMSDRLHLLRQPLAGREGSPLQRMIDAGLTRAQIDKIGGPPDPDEARAAERGRITAWLAEAEAEIAQIERWQASGRRDHGCLAGLGFDTLIEAARTPGEGGAP